MTVQLFGLESRKWVVDEDDGRPRRHRLRRAGDIPDQLQLPHAIAELLTRRRRSYDINLRGALLYKVLVPT